MAIENAAESQRKTVSVADLGMVLGAVAGAADRYQQFCHKIAKVITVVGGEFNSGAERGFSSVAGAHRLDEIAEEARRHRDAEHRSVQSDAIEMPGPKSRPPSVVTATVACSQYATTKRTLQRAIQDGRLRDFRENGRSSNSPLLVDLQEVAKNWPKRGATK